MNRLVPYRWMLRAMAPATMLLALAAPGLMIVLAVVR